MGFLDRLRGGDDEEDAAREAREARAEEDLRRLAAGSVPVAAEQRLAELAAGTTAFTSNLSVADFALTRSAGIRPLGQVQGSAVYKIGWRNYPWKGAWGSGSVTELETLTQAWNEARRLALGRLATEAEMVGCDAVVDVTFLQREHDFLTDDIEVIVTGTAVRLPEGRRGSRPVLTDLSMPDAELLRRAGYVAAGVVTATSVFYVVPSWTTVKATTGWQRYQPNQELKDYTQAIYSARETVLARVSHQAAQQGADGMVGMQIDHDIAVREVERNNTEFKDLIVTFHVLGTAIRAEGEHRPLSPDLVVRQNPARRTTP